MDCGLSLFRGRLDEVPEGLNGAAPVQGLARPIVQQVSNRAERHLVMNGQVCALGQHLLKPQQVRQQVQRGCTQNKQSGSLLRPQGRQWVFCQRRRGPRCCTSICSTTALGKTQHARR